MERKELHELKNWWRETNDPTQQLWFISFSLSGKASTCSAGDTGDESLIRKLGRSPGEGNDYPLQYSHLGNLTDWGAWWATVHGVAKSWTPLSNFTFLCINPTTTVFCLSCSLSLEFPPYSWTCYFFGTRLLCCVKSLKSCLTLCDPIYSSLPGSSVTGILQIRILEWLPCPPPGDLPNPGIEPASLTSPALAGEFFTTNATWEVLRYHIQSKYKQCFSFYIVSSWSWFLIKHLRNHRKRQGRETRYLEKILGWLVLTINQGSCSSYSIFDRLDFLVGGQIFIDVGLGFMIYFGQWNVNRCDKLPFLNLTLERHCSFYSPFLRTFRFSYKKNMPEEDAVRLAWFSEWDT